ncbi:MAG: energy transducer TonB [Chloracidobacterium sp.]|nr:energy transducer TonB [Chloracidobacterium sp.]
MRLIILASIAALSVINLFAQEKSITVEPYFLGEAQPTKIKLPLPEYPKDAKKAGLGGRVSVIVTVDENGHVTTGGADGPYPVCQSVTTPSVLALRLAATNAAKKAEFKPALVNEKPVSVNGRINYLFTTPPTKQSKEDSMKVAFAGSAEPTEKLTEGQNGDPSLSPKTVGGGVLNGKAMSLAKPPYPAAAKAIRAGGAVSVQVVILEDGSMYSAEAFSGHPLLRRSSEIAACSSKFTPTLLSGQPVKVSGIIVYNYVP